MSGLRSLATIHGATRIRKRLGVPTRALTRLVARALERGQRVEDLSGRLRLWAAQREKNGATCRLHAGNCFIFNELGQVVTAYPIPKDLLVGAKEGGV